MKHLLITTIAAVLLVGCGESQQSTPQAETKPKPTTAKAPDISIHEAVKQGYVESVKKPMDIPTYPSEKYKNGGWKNWGDWLGTGNVAVFLKEFRPFEEERSLVRSLNLRSTEEWKEFVKTKRSKDIPSTPERTYKGKGWINYSDWLGNPINNRKEYKTYLEARKYVRKQRLKTYKDWNE